MGKNKVKQKFEEEVMKKIHKGQIRMRPRIYFVLGSVMVGVGLVLLVGLSALVTHAFYVRLVVLARMGFENVSLGWCLMWMRFFPWEMLIVAMLMILVGGYLLRKYEFVYKRGLGLALVVMVLVIVVLTMLMNWFGLDGFVRQKPVLKQLYMYQEHPRGLDEWRERYLGPGTPGSGKVRGVKQFRRL